MKNRAQYSTIALVRHFEDIKDLSTRNRDTMLAPVPKAKVAAIANDILNFMERTEKKQLVIYCDSTIRCRKSMRLIVEKLKQLKPSVVIKLKKEIGVTTLKQAKYKLKKIKPTFSKEVYKIFFNESFLNKNLKYRHGDPVIIKGVPKYKILQDNVLEFGEDHLTFTKRFYSFFRRFVQQVQRDRESMFLLVTHIVIIYRFLELEKLFEVIGSDKINLEDYSNLPFLEWSMKDYLYKDKNPDKNISTGSLFMINIENSIHNISYISKFLKLSK